MTISSATLNLLAFPQRWDADAGTLLVRFLCLPQGGPATPLGADLPTFAAANLQFEARLIGSLASAPRAEDSVGMGPLQLTDPPTQKAVLFDQLARLIEIDEGAAPSPGPVPVYRKPATDTYRELTGNRRLSEYLIDGGDYECALHGALDSQPPEPSVLPASLRWGQVIALALRQPKLAAALGLIGEAVIRPTDGFFARGGWLYVTLHSTGVGADVAGLAVSHAARIPPLAETRVVYAAVLFPVDRPGLTLDDIYRDAERYDTGHARLVHAAQTESASTDGDAIRLAWDDEQLAEWLNRQLKATNAAPMGTAGYRVDVREVGTAQWNSLQKIRSIGDLTVGAVVLGSYQGEGMVEVVPTQIAPNLPGEFWMPPYFTTWRGTSLVLTDRALNQLHQRSDIPFEGDPASRLDRERTFEPVDDTAARLLYGHSYEFRVRLADLTAGGPGPQSSLPPTNVSDDAHHTATVAFRRRRPPGPVEVLQRPTRADKKLVVARPKLGYPEILYTGAAVTFQKLQQAFDADLAAGRARGLGLPDPDVTELQITVQVRALAGDRLDWHDLYPLTRSFGDQERLELVVDLLDRPTLSGFPAPAIDGALPLPTARDVRLVLVPVSRDDKNYFASEDARTGPPVTVELHVTATNETTLTTGQPELVSFFFRQPPPDGSVARPAERLANELELDHHDLTLAGRAGHRTVIGCSANLRHALSPERSAITLSSDADATQRWIHALRFTLARDWTWRGLAEDGIAVYRQIGRGTAPMEAAELVGTIALPHALSSNATTDIASDHLADVRQSTSVVFFDAHDPKPDPAAQPPEYPTEQAVRYELVPTYENGEAGDRGESPAIELPVTTPPAQLPQLMSAGIAFQANGGTDDYAVPRTASLWLEFANPPRDNGDAYFVRPLVTAPDPLLIDVPVAETQPEPAMPIDPEWMRMIHVGQPPDFNGALAMQALPRRAEEGQCYLVPLPEGVDASSPDLFGMYTYEIRVGHADQRWCTAQGRWGPPLRVTGVKHPPPPLTCQATRVPEGILVQAPFATPTLQGRHVRPISLKTRLWALLYARVQQADAAAWRHILLGRAAPLVPVDGGTLAAIRPQPVLFGEGGFEVKAIQERLQIAGLPDDAALAVLVVEFSTEPEFGDPLGDDLGQAQFLRTSALVPVPAAC